MPFKEPLDPLFKETDEPQLRDVDEIIYLVYKQGYFGHGAHAISLDKDSAINLAKKAAGRDIDAHHAYDVYDIPLDRLPEQSSNPMNDFGWMNREPLFSVTKGDNDSFEGSDAPQPLDEIEIVFLVYKQGYFGHGTHAINLDKDDAINLAKKSAGRDIDAHHSYDVYVIPLGRLPEQSNNFMKDFGWMNRVPVFSIKKGDNN